MFCVAQKLNSKSVIDVCLYNCHVTVDPDTRNKLSVFCMKTDPAFSERNFNVCLSTSTHITSGVQHWIWKAEVFSSSWTCMIRTLEVLPYMLTVISQGNWRATRFPNPSPLPLSLLGDLQLEWRCPVLVSGVCMLKFCHASNLAPAPEPTRTTSTTTSDRRQIAEKCGIISGSTKNR